MAPPPLDEQKPGDFAGLSFWVSATGSSSPRASLEPRLSPPVASHRITNFGADRKRDRMHQPWHRWVGSFSDSACSVFRSFLVASLSESWLPFLNAYRTMCIAPGGNFQGVLEEVQDLQLAA